MEPARRLELGPGLTRSTFDRRRALLAGGAAALALAARAQQPGGPAQPGTRIAFDEFLRLANATARELVGDTSPEGQDRYLLALAAIAVRLESVPEPEMRELRAGYRLGANPGGEAFNVLHWKLDAGARIGDHPHIYGNVVTLLLDGTVRIRNHEVDGERDYDSKDPFLVRRTHDHVLRPGAVNLVGLDRDYTHGFVAGPEGARGLDITTRIREKRPTPSLEVGELVDEARALYRARWTTEADE